MMLLLSLKELSPRLDRNNPKLIMICWLRQQWQIISLFQKTGGSVEQFARNGKGLLSPAAACFLQYFTQNNDRSQSVKYVKSAHSLHRAFHNNGSYKTGKKTPQFYTAQWKNVNVTSVVHYSAILQLSSNSLTLFCYCHVRWQDTWDANKSHWVKNMFSLLLSFTLFLYLVMILLLSQFSNIPLIKSLN